MEFDEIKRLIGLFENEVIPEKTLTEWTEHFRQVSTYRDYSETKISIELWLDECFSFDADEEEEVVTIILNGIYGEF